MSLLLLVLGCTGSGEAPAEPRVASALDDDAFRFCHVPGAHAEASKEWCELVADLPEDRCPGLHATCAGAPAVADPGELRGCDEEDGEGPADRLAGAPEPPPEPNKGCEPPTIEGLGSLMRWVAAITVAVAILILFRVLWGTFGRARPAADPLPPPPVASDEESELPDVPDAPSGDLLAAARAALQAGRYGEAVLMARAAALRRLGEAGRLRLHRSRTDREYVRSLRGEADLQRDLRQVMRAVEVHRWGGDPVGADLASKALGAAERLVGALVVLLLLLGSVPAGAQTPGRYAPDGDAALLELLELHGYEAGWRLRSLEDVDEDVDALILDHTAVSPTLEQWDHLRAWVEQGGVLVVGGDASEPFPELAGRHTVSGGHTVAAGPLVGSGTPPPRFSGGPLYAYEGGQAWVVDSADGGAVVAVADVGQGVIVGIADARLLWNGSFAHPDNEAFLGDLLYLGQALQGWPLPTPARVQLATTAAVAAPSSGGASGNNPFASMANARLLLFVLQLLATWALLGLWRGWPFAPLRDPPDTGRLDFAEHVVALGTRWYRLRASRHAAVRTAELWLARLGPAGLQLAAERAGRTPEQARAWVDGLVAFVTSPRGEDSPADLELVEELWRVTSRR